MVAVAVVVLVVVVVVVVDIVAVWSGSGVFVEEWREGEREGGKGGVLYFVCGNFVVVVAVTGLHSLIFERNRDCATVPTYSVRIQVTRLYCRSNWCSVSGHA